MNCGEILITWLRKHGYNGLANLDLECGCGLDSDDFVPCGYLGADCQPAYRDDERDGWFINKPEKKK